MNELEHSGVPGMEWYKRHYQSYRLIPTRSGKVGQEFGKAAAYVGRKTADAAKKVGKGVSKGASVAKKKAGQQAVKAKAKAKAKYEHKKEVKQRRQHRDPRWLAKHFDEIPDTELEKYIKRLTMRNNLHKQTNLSMNAGREYIKTILGYYDTGKDLFDRFQEAQPKKKAKPNKSSGSSSGGSSSGSGSKGNRNKNKSNRNTYNYYSNQLALPMKSKKKRRFKNKR